MIREVIEQNKCLDILGNHMNQQQRGELKKFRGIYKGLWIQTFLIML